MGIVGVAGAVDGRKHVLVRGESEVVEHRRALGGTTPRPLDGVVHHVAGPVDHRLVDPLLSEVLDAALGRREEEIRDVIGEHAVDLLGHRPVVASEAGLDVGEASVGLRGHDRARERRVRVAVHHDDVGRFAFDDLAEPTHHRSGLSALRIRAHPEVVLRGRDVQFLEEHVGHGPAVVLAGVDEDLLVAFAERARDRERLHELRARADDRDDPHCSAPGCRAGSSGSPASCSRTPSASLVWRS
jgi:hypothetical protein